MAHVLVLEPDVRLGEVYAKALQARHHQVTSCATAQAAVCEADSVCPDLIVLELQLTGHSGIEFLYELRSYTDWQQIPVVILSHVPPAEFDKSSNLLRHHLGVRAYYYKPQTSLLALQRAVDAELSEPDIRRL